MDADSDREQHWLSCHVQSGIGKYNNRINYVIINQLNVNKKYWQEFFLFQFLAGQNYCFSVRAVAIDKRTSPYSNVCKVKIWVLKFYAGEMYLIFFARIVSYLYYITIVQKLWNMYKWNACIGWLKTRLSFWFSDKKSVHLS